MVLEGTVSRVNVRHRERAHGRAHGLAVRAALKLSYEAAWNEMETYFVSATVTISRHMHIAWWLC